MMDGRLTQINNHRILSFNLFVLINGRTCFFTTTGWTLSSWHSSSIHFAPRPATIMNDLIEDNERGNYHADLFRVAQITLNIMRSTRIYEWKAQGRQCTKISTSHHANPRLGWRRWKTKELGRIYSFAALKQSRIQKILKNKNNCVPQISQGFWPSHLPSKNFAAPHIIIENFNIINSPRAKHESRPDHSHRRTPISLFQVFGFNLGLGP